MPPHRRNERGNYPDFKYLKCQSGDVHRQAAGSGIFQFQLLLLPCLLVRAISRGGAIVYGSTQNLPLASRYTLWKIFAKAV